MEPLVFLSATFAAAMYAVGSYDIKRSLSRGTNLRTAIAWTNIAMALWSLPLLLLSRETFTITGLMYGLGAGAALFFGRILVVKALDVGDLSVVGPLLGLKTLLVAVFALGLGQVGLSPGLWFAVGLASVGLFLVQRGPKSRCVSRNKAIRCAVMASVLFASTDILVVEAREHLSVGFLMPTVFLTVGLLVPLLGKIPPPPTEGSKSLKLGAVIMGFQTSLVVLVISLTGEAVVVNIIYATRALWSVVVDRITNREGVIRAYFAPRIIGAVMLVMAVGVVIRTLHPTGGEEERSADIPGVIWIEGY